MDDREYQRYVHINLPHARTIVQRMGRSLIAHGAFPEEGEAGEPLHDALSRPGGRASRLRRGPDGGDRPAGRRRGGPEARGLVDALLETTVRGDRLGQNVRNLFECLGLPEEGAAQSLRCGERPDSPLR